jgi:hypothetical protein
MNTNEKLTWISRRAGAGTRYYMSHGGGFKITKTMDEADFWPWRLTGRTIEGALNFKSLAKAQAAAEELHNQPATN